jgi:hypothetical protein
MLSAGMRIGITEPGCLIPVRRQYLVRGAVLRMLRAAERG